MFYLPGNETTLNLKKAAGSFEVYWYNPRSGGELLQTEIKIVEGGSEVTLGRPSQDIEKDWAILIKKHLWGNGKESE